MKIQDVFQQTLKYAKNLLQGAGSILNLFPVRRLSSHRFYTPSASDHEALRKDGMKLGRDVHIAFEVVETNL